VEYGRDLSLTVVALAAPLKDAPAPMPELGATRDEVARPLPGDDLLATPDMVSMKCPLHANRLRRHRFGH
jgi:hypothetical protein